MGSRVLVVDDEEDILMSMRDFLESELRLEPLMASSGAKALETMRGTTVDLVISDFRMPVMDGLELLKRVAGLYPEVPRILVTAYPDVDLAGAAVNEAKVSRFLTKPLKPAVLAGAVRDVLSKSKRERLGKEAFRRSGEKGSDLRSPPGPGS